MNLLSRPLRVMALCVALWPLMLNAQTPPLPPGPLIQKHAPDFAKWTITIQYGSLDDPAPSPGAGGTKPIPPAVTTVTKTGQVINLAIPLSGQTWNVWNLGTLKILVDPESKSCGTVVPTTVFVKNPFDVDFSKTDFDGFEWISPGNYVGTKTYEGKKCIQFKTENNEAYIDFETRLPVALDLAGEEHLFQFMTPPTDTLTVPPVVQAYLDQRKKEAARYARVPLAPF